MIEPLQELKAIQVIKEIPTEGHSPLLVLADDYSFYYVKTIRNTIPDFFLINEFLCHYLLNYWGISTPSIARMTINADLLPEALSNNRLRANLAYSCFASKQIENATELQQFVVSDRAGDYNKLLNPEILLQLGLFDIWVENDDRKPSNSNLLIAPFDNKLKIIAIDNAFTFSSMNYKDLMIGEVSSSYNDSILLSSLGEMVKEKTRIDLSWKSQVEEKYYLCIQNCKDNFQDIVENIPSDLGFSNELKQKIYDFLFDTERNKKVFFEYLDRLS